MFDFHNLSEEEEEVELPAKLAAKKQKDKANKKAVQVVSKPDEEGNDDEHFILHFNSRCRVF